MTQSVGIIGLGRTGMAAAKALIRHGFKIFGCDPDVRAAEELITAGGTALQSPGEVAYETSIVLVFVLDDSQAKEAIAGEQGITSKVTPASIVVCMSTVNRDTSPWLDKRCREKNVAFIDCPFTGGPARIDNGSATLIAAGNFQALERVRSVLEVIGKIVYAGSEPGQGQAIKHCNQLLVGVTHAAVMEVICLARKLGLDPSLVTSVAGSGIAGSDYFRMLSASVLERTPSPGGLGQMCKDMGIVTKTLDEAGFEAKAALAAAAYFETARQLGMAGREGADLIEVVEKSGTNKDVIND
jgi:3-hydroxyisobutyrate dehydrogenase-like beta-hydroxyacid dehydrogenase